MLQIKDYSGSAADLGLYFVVEEDVLGQTVEHELLPRGRDVPVSDGNKLMYVYLCAHWHISRINSAAAQAFSRGLSQVIPISFLRMFTVVEVNELLGGTAAADGVSVADMQHHCAYKGGYTRSSNTVRHCLPHPRGVSGCHARPHNPALFWHRACLGHDCVDVCGARARSACTHVFAVE